MINTNSYLDANATTPLDPVVLEGMLPFLSQHFGNPSSIHEHGRIARDAISHARKQVALFVNVEPEQVIFTSGGTEANNLAIQGVAHRSSPKEMLASSVEHDSVLESMRALSFKGWKIHHIPMTEVGQLDENQFEYLLNANTVLMAQMLVNNETGSIYQPQRLKEMAVQKKLKPYLLVDAVQAAGKIEIDFNALQADFLTLSAHKIYGPKGVGAFVYRRGVDFSATQDGGGQEYGFRSGTENVAGIVGFGIACELAQQHMQASETLHQRLHQIFEDYLKTMPHILIIGAQHQRIANTTLLAFPGIDGETLSLWLNDMGFSVSSGSACSNGKTRSSHVVAALHVPEVLQNSTLRISFTKYNTEQDVLRLCEALKTIEARVRQRRL